MVNNIGDSSKASRFEPSSQHLRADDLLDKETKETVHQNIEEQASSAPSPKGDVFESGAAAIHQNANRPPVSHVMSLFTGGRWGKKAASDEQTIAELKNLIGNPHLSSEEQNDLIGKIDTNSARKNVELEKKLKLFKQIKDDDVLNTMIGNVQGLSGLERRYITDNVSTSYKQLDKNFKHVQNLYQKMKKDPIYLRTELSLLDKQIEKDEKLSSKQKYDLQALSAVQYGKKTAEVKAQIAKVTNLYEKMKLENPTVGSPTNVKHLYSDLLKETLISLVESENKRGKA